MKRWVLVGVIVVLAGAAIAYVTLRGESAAPSYRFVAVERGDLDAVVSATGTLSAVTTVQVGTQVSGLIARLSADFNDRVEKGQVIAMLDTTLLDTSLRDVEASRERTRAELAQAERDLERITSLYEQGISSVADLNRAQYNYDVASAQIKSVEASLSRARQNLAYATITAPVSGIVVDRAVDVGQTVAASLSAPRLFTIANDLSEMQILAPVDESDIGKIKEGQKVRFSVKTYPDRKFEGEVKQVRLQSTVEQNIVNYPVVIAVRNEDGVLLPGMTATVEFVVASARDVLKVANGALRFRPPDALLAEARERMQKEIAARRAAQGGAGEPRRNGDAPGGSMMPGVPPVGGESRGGGTAGNNGSVRSPREASMLYFLGKDGKLSMMPARPGITDGQFTEVRGRMIEEGMQVIAGMTQAAQKGSTNPFQPARPQSGPGRPPGML